VEEALGLDPGDGVEQGGQAQRVRTVPPGELPPPQDPATPGPVDRGLAVAAPALALLAVLSLWAVFVFWSSNSAATALPFLAVPAVLFAAAGSSP
jgi:hypothetical protein